MFTKGCSGNPSGRPKGAKDKKYLKLEYWFDQFEANLGQISASLRARLAMEMMKTLITRTKDLPETQEQAKSNAEETFKLLKELEAQSEKRFRDGNAKEGQL